jgi:hypothetical protein
LRSAYLSHNPDGGGDGARGRSRQRAGAPGARIAGTASAKASAGALLGYRIERELHEKGADRLNFSWRRIAPLLQGKLSDRKDALLPAPAQEAIAATNVVNGVDLVAKYQGKVVGFSPQKIRDLLDVKPADNPYLTGLVWPKVSNDEWAAAAARSSGPQQPSMRSVTCCLPKASISSQGNVSALLPPWMLRHPATVRRPADLLPHPRWAFPSSTRCWSWPTAGNRGI